ncbi:uncharacterized protein CTRU02_201095 [Colletotrichum truncatum]|uniref:Uncharacterized protein n=1 Tax=Colletotrichum truncatum TaxID=5467 RepID=A0ACC3ZGJ1_COLTU|nr:uncharacterized protein CTRU02_12409 [Colletotrichum truncatum]KAF6784704.1 hypothetical protein CTRU02_12409 [Colletotrichum truncatum]
MAQDMELAAELVPDKIGDIKIPTELPAELPSMYTHALGTGYYLTHGIPHASNTLINNILDNEEAEARNLIDVRSAVKNGRRQKKALKYKRAQNANSFLMHVYGNAREGKDQCKNCIKGNGPYNTCVVLDGYASCANCTYNSGASNCSFAPSPSKRPAAEIYTSAPSSKKLCVSRAEYDFLNAVRGVKPKHIRLIRNTLVSVADKLADVKYDENENIEIELCHD